MKAIIIIQARVESKRLPEKILININGKTIIEHIFERCEKSVLKAKTIIATSTNKEDDKLVELLNTKKIPYFRGSEKNVLLRFYEAAKNENADIIIRVCGDSPFIDFKAIDRLILTIINDDYDYVAYKNSDCIGLTAEALTFLALEKTYKEAKENYQLEHVTPYIYENPDIFKIKYLEYKLKYEFQRSLRLTLDTIDDFKLIEIIYKNLYKGKVIEIDELLDFLKENQALIEINSNVKQKSYKEAEE
ncbi:MAG TPA: glycosyltransferase family protein [bacterium]|nr:glycosyltransferase family protein [bacterium]HOL47848.1 glycosyltransferase family protein [bacterium]HPQ19854.1 glycosyltransferase family protein [bacterium]